MKTCPSCQLLNISRLEVCNRCGAPLGSAIQNPHRSPLVVRAATGVGAIAGPLIPFLWHVLKNNPRDNLILALAYHPIEGLITVGLLAVIGAIFGRLAGAYVALFQSLRQGSINLKDKRVLAIVTGLTIIVGGFIVYSLIRISHGAY